MTTTSGRPARSPERIARLRRSAGELPASSRFLSPAAADRTASAQELRAWAAGIARENVTAGRPSIRLFTSRPAADTHGEPDDRR